MGAMVARPQRGQRAKYTVPGGTSLASPYVGSVMGSKHTFALLVSLLVGASCGGPGGSDPGGDRDVAIYAAVIRHMTSEQGQASGYPVIYVLDRVHPAAADPDSTAEPSTPILDEVQAALREALADVGEIEFVSDADSVTGPEGQGSRVMGGGILITLGPIRGEGERVEVPANSYLANLAASWQTWVVEARNGSWSVTGTTGPVAVS
jgi:hypothetical protein